MTRFVALLLVLLASSNCAERQFDHPDADLLPVCMSYPAKGWDAHGDATFIVAPDGSTGRTCGCMTEEEFEQDVYLDEYHERALQECFQLAADYGYETNNCQDMHDEGGWLIYMRPAIVDYAWLTIGKDIPCSEQATAEGCSASGDRSSPLPLLALLLLGLPLARRRLRDHASDISVGRARWSVQAADNSST